MTPIEFIVFLVPAVELIVSFCLRVIFAKTGTTRYLAGEAKYGIKGYMLRTPLTYASFACYLLSPLFIPYGWFWFAYGALLLGAYSIFLIVPAAESTPPVTDSRAFDELTSVRRRQGLLAAPVLLCWCLSWL